MALQVESFWPTQMAWTSSLTQMLSLSGAFDRSQLRVTLSANDHAEKVSAIEMLDGQVPGHWTGFAHSGNIYVGAGLLVECWTSSS